MKLDRLLTILISFYEAVQTVKWLKHNDTSNYILIVSHVLHGGGAPIVLWETVQVLSGMGYKVVVASPGSGSLAHVMRENSIDVLICKRFKKLLRKYVLSRPWKAAIVNTIEMHKWVQGISGNIPVIWWLHEGRTYAENYKGSSDLFLKENVSTVCVSDWSKKCLSRVGVPVNAPILYYGLKRNEITEYTGHGRFTFTMIGSICKRKRVIDFLDAISLLSMEVEAESRFLIIGKGIPSESDYMELFKDKLSQIEGVEYIEFVPNDKISEIYQQTDVLVCTSDDDPLPVVVSDAFMYKKAVLISDSVGQYTLVEDGVSGYTFHTGNVKELSEKMESIVHRRRLNDEVAQRGYSLYVRNFTIESHREQLENLLKYASISKGI